MSTSMAQIGHNGGPPLDAISEAASKKQRRGRPRVVPKETMSTYAWLHPGIKTDRGRQNIDFMYYGLRVLGLEPNDSSGREQFGWLVDWAAADRHQKGAIKKGIIAEIGRLARHAGTDTARQIAAMVCKRKPTVKEGITLLRRVRVGHEARDDDDKLLSRLAAVVDQYRIEHPSCPTATMLNAINELYCIASDIGERQRPASANGAPS